MAKNKDLTTTGFILNEFCCSPVSEVVLKLVKTDILVVALMKLSCATAVFIRHKERIPWINRVINCQSC